MRARAVGYVFGPVLFFLLITGCTPDTHQNTLRVWDWWSPVEGEKMRDYFRIVEREYETLQPGIDLRFQHIPFGPQYIQKIMAGMAAKRPPDCMHVSMIWANDLYERGVLCDLRPFIERTPEMADNVWLKAALRYGRDGDYVYGIPIEQDAACIVYNLDLFEEAGLGTDPFVFETWEDFRQGAIKLTKWDDNGRMTQAGFMVSANDLSAYLPWMYSNGGRFYSDDQQSSAFNEAPMREAMQFMQDLLHKDRVSFPIISERQDFQLFLQGRVAMFIGGTWTGHIIDEQAPGMRFGMMSFPKGPRGSQRSGMTWTNLMCIPKGCAQPELAWDFLTYYCGMKNAIHKLASIERNSPLVAFYETPEWRAAVTKHPSLAMIPHITEVGGLYPVVRFTEIDSLFQPMCQGIMLNNLVPEDALNALQPRVDEILKRYYADLEEAYR